MKRATKFRHLYLDELTGDRTVAEVEWHDPPPDAPGFRGWYLSGTSVQALVNAGLYPTLADATRAAGRPRDARTRAGVARFWGATPATVARASRLKV